MQTDNMLKTGVLVNMVYIHLSMPVTTRFRDTLEREERFGVERNIP